MTAVVARQNKSVSFLSEAKKESKISNALSLWAKMKQQIAGFPYPLEGETKTHKKKKLMF